jgi:histidyl-tRNA synthetase
VPHDIQVTFSPADVAHVAGFVAEMQSVKNNIHKVAQTLEQAHGNQMAGKLGELAFGKQFKTAAESGAKLALIYGGDELAKGVVKIRDLTDRSEREVPRAAVLAHVRDFFTAG